MKIGAPSRATLSHSCLSVVGSVISCVGVRRDGNSTRCCPWVLFLSAVMVIFSGCSNDSGYSNKFDDVVAEYEAEAATLTLPNSVGWPTDGASVYIDAEQEAGFFQDGFGKLTADRYYLCSWQREYSEATDEQSKVEALEKIAGFRSLYAYTTSYDNATREIFEENIGSAELGDSTGIIDDLDINC